MSILNVPIPTPTPEQIVHKQLVLPIQAQYSTLLAHYNNGMANVWQNGLGLSPQEIMDALGTYATQLVAIAAGTRDLINSIVPNSLPTGTPFPMTFNNDGTVTIVMPSG